jgi:hypothetical protein
MTPSKEAMQDLLLLHRSFKNALLVSMLPPFVEVVLATKKRVKFPIARMSSLVKKEPALFSYDLHFECPLQAFQGTGAWEGRQRSKLQRRSFQCFQLLFLLLPRSRQS